MTSEPTIGIRPHRVTAGTFALLDQRRLPEATLWLPISTPEMAADAIRDMVVRGAPAIGITAAYGLALLGGAAADDVRWRAACRTLLDSRPTAVNLAWAVARMDRARQSAGAESVAGILWDEAATIDRQDVAMNIRIGRFGAGLIPGSAVKVLTHCNAGALATGGWGTALGVIRALHAEGRLHEAWATETRPYGQGARLTTWEFRTEGIPHRLLPDSAVAAALRSQALDAVVVGADRIAADGSVANKIGTYAIALAAHRHGVPFYVAAPGSTLDPATATGADIPIEMRDGAEVRTLRGIELVPAETPVWNPAFDVTPPELITAIILDIGVARPPFARSLQTPDRER